MLTTFFQPFPMRLEIANRLRDVWNASSPDDEQARVVACGDRFAVQLEARPAYVGPEL